MDEALVIADLVRSATFWTAVGSLAAVAVAVFAYIQLRRDRPPPPTPKPEAPAAPRDTERLGVWPERKPGVLGRDALILDLHEASRPWGARVGVLGPGGFGKSTLVREYLEAYAGR